METIEGLKLDTNEELIMSERKRERAGQYKGFA